jgi:hypothetical protein
VSCRVSGRDALRVVWRPTPLTPRSANWVSDIAYDNRTGYDRTTGSGAYGVEFAGTGVSSPS